jgi:hypothetical protein
MSPWAIGIYCLLVLIYTVPVTLFIRRRMKIRRAVPIKGDQSVQDGLVGTLPVDRW